MAREATSIPITRTTVGPPAIQLGCCLMLLKRDLQVAVLEQELAAVFR